LFDEGFGVAGAVEEAEVGVAVQLRIRHPLPSATIVSTATTSKILGYSAVAVAFTRPGGGVGPVTGRLTAAGSDPFDLGPRDGGLLNAMGVSPRHTGWPWGRQRADLNVSSKNASSDGLSQADLTHP
jgi:hypothetical protein